LYNETFNKIIKGKRDFAVAGLSLYICLGDKTNIKTNRIR